MADDTLRMVLEAKDNAQRVLREHAADIEHIERVARGVAPSLHGATNAIQGVDKASGDAATRLDHLGTSAQQGSGHFSGLIQKAGLVVSALGGIGIGAGFLGAIKGAGDLQQAVANISTIKPDIDTSAVFKSLNEMSTRVPQSSKDLADSLYNIFSSVEVSQGDALRLTETFAKGAVGASTDAATFGTSVLGVMNAYGLAASDAGHISDVFFNAINKGVITGTELAGSLGPVTQSAKAAGVSLDELGGLIAGVTKEGGPAAENVNNLNNMLQKITTVDAQAAIRGLGVATTDSSGKFRPILDVLTDLKPKLEGMSESAKALALQKIFPDAQARIGAQTILSQLDFVKQAVEDNKTSTGSAASAYEKMSATFNSQFTLMKNTAMSVLTAIGANVLPLITPLITAFASHLPAAFEAAKLAVGDWVTKLEPMARSIAAEVVPAVRDLAHWIADVLAPALADFWKGDVLPKLQTFADVMKNQIVPAATDLAGTLAGVLVPALQNTIGFIAEHKEVLVGFGIGITAVLVPAFAAWALAAGAAAVATIAAAAPVIAIVAGIALLAAGIILLVKNWDDVTDALSRTGEGLVIVKDAIGTFVTEIVPNVAGKLAELGGKFASWVADAVPPMLAALGGLLVDLTGWIVGDGLPALGRQLAEWAAAFGGWVKDATPPLLENLGGLALDLGNWIVEQAPGVGEKLLEWGLAFAAWVVDAVPPLLLELGKLWVAVHLWLGEQALALGLKLAEWGLAFIEWIGPQIPGMLLELGKLWIGIQVWIVQKIVDLHVELAKWGLAFIEWIALDVLPKLPGALGDIITAIAGWVSGAIGRVASETAKVGASVIEGVKSGIQGAMGAMITYAEGVAGDIVRAIKDRLKVFSPSQVTAQEVGVPLIQGIQMGMALQLPAAIAQAEAGAAAIAAAFTNGIGNITGKAGTAFSVGPTSSVNMGSYSPSGGVVKGDTTTFMGMVSDFLNGTGAGGIGPGGTGMYVMPTGGFAQQPFAALGGAFGAGNVAYSQNPFFDPNYTTPFNPVNPAGNQEADDFQKEQAAKTQADLTGEAVAKSLAGMAILLDINGEQVFGRFVDTHIGTALQKAGVG